MLILIVLVLLLLATFGDVNHRFILNGLALSEFEVPPDVLFRINRLICKLQGLWSDRMRFLLSQRNCPIFPHLLESIYFALSKV